jgi:hypothetical protein
MSLMAHSRQAARDAAAATLQKQAEGAEGVATNVVIRSISEQNAVSSAQAMVPFVGRRVQEIPAIVRWAWKSKHYCGITRTANEAQTTTLHACYLAPAAVRASARSRLCVAWSVASMQFAPRNDDFVTLPGILERLHGASSIAERGKRGELVASRVAAMVLGETESPRPVALSGVTRSVISAATRLLVHHTQVKVGEAIGDVMAQGVSLGRAEHNLGDAPVLEAVEQDAVARSEPLCSPATRLALGIGMNEELRTWMVGKTRKNDPCKVLLGTTTAQERGRDAPAIINSEPPPLLTIVDVHLEAMPQEAGQPLTAEFKFGMALHVCGDGIVRVPEMLAALGATLQGHAFVQQARAVVWAAMSQASYISNVGPVISAGFANSAISSSKKISVGCPLSRTRLQRHDPLTTRRSQTTTACCCSRRSTSTRPA